MKSGCVNVPLALQDFQPHSITTHQLTIQALTKLDFLSPPPVALNGRFTISELKKKYIHIISSRETISDRSFGILACIPLHYHYTITLQIKKEWETKRAWG